MRKTGYTTWIDSKHPQSRFKRYGWNAATNQIVIEWRDGRVSRSNVTTATTYKRFKQSRSKTFFLERELGMAG